MGTRPGGGRGWPEGPRGAWEPTWLFLLGFKIARGRWAEEFRREGAPQATVGVSRGEGKWGALERRGGAGDCGGAPGEGRIPRFTCPPTPAPEPLASGPIWVSDLRSPAPPRLLPADPDRAGCLWLRSLYGDSGAGSGRTNPAESPLGKSSR